MQESWPPIWMNEYFKVDMSEYPSSTSMQPALVDFCCLS